MKKVFVCKSGWPFLILLGLFAVSCNKDPKVDVKNVTITKENVVPQTVSVEINGSYEFPSVLKTIDVCLGKNENLDDAKSYPAEINGYDFQVNIDDLKGNTTYYYCYEFSNGMNKTRSDMRSFKTNPYEDAAVETDSVTSVKAKTAVCYGTILNTGGYDVIKCGVCWSTYNQPSMNHHKDTMPNANGRFVVEMTDLTPGRDYYAWAYFFITKDAYHPVYGQPIKFTTKNGEPTVQIKTNESEIGISSAVCRYVIWTDFSLPINEHGICWSRTNSNPTPDNCDGKQTGVGGFNNQGFTAEMTGLTEGKKYYVRAYATNEVDTYPSNNVWEFTTHTGKPVFNGFNVIRIKDTKAVILGSVTNGGDPSISIDNWMFYWSKTYPNPDSSHNDGTIQPSDWGQTNMNGLDPEQDYYVRPYVEYNGDRHEYGETMHFKTTKKGGLTGAFTINDNGGKVCFSQGNLQYLGSLDRWKLADNQWEYLGDNGQGSANQTADRDLFGWGTSGNPHGAVEYYPWATALNYTKYYAYGEYYYNLFDKSGEADWGHNRIYVNEYNTIHDDDGWRTLTNAEWAKLLNVCKWAGRFSPGSIVVDGTTYRGHILLPDDWTGIEDITFIPNATDWTTNTYDKNQWYEMEAKGAAFLPAAGYREGVSVGHFNSVGYYWSSSAQGEDSAWRMKFDKTGYEKDPAYRFRGLSVRLVHTL